MGIAVGTYRTLVARAYKRLGIHSRNELMPDYMPGPVVGPAPRRGVPPAMRFKVLARDKFRCVYCGRTANEVRLEVDHVKPVSKGGATVPANLVTACADCNVGKGGAV